MFVQCAGVIPKGYLIPLSNEERIAYHSHSLNMPLMVSCDKVWRRQRAAGCVSTIGVSRSRRGRRSRKFSQGYRLVYLFWNPTNNFKIERRCTWQFLALWNKQPDIYKKELCKSHTPEFRGIARMRIVDSLNYSGNLRKQECGIQLHGNSLVHGLFELARRSATSLHYLVNKLRNYCANHKKRE